MDPQRPEEFKPKRSLARRLALIQLPLVLIPLLLLGAAAYLRTRTILLNRATQDMVTTTEDQVNTMLEWAAVRDQRLFLSSQRGSTLDAARQLLEDPQDETALEAMRTELEAARRTGETYFSSVDLVRTEDGLILASSNAARVGGHITALVEGRLPASGTAPLIDDPEIAPGSLAFVSVAPLRLGDPTPLLLVGVNAGTQVGKLMESMQVFWERRGVYRVERGRTYLIHPPDTLFELPRYGTSLEMLAASQNPILQQPMQAETQWVRYQSPEGGRVLAAYQYIPQWDLAVAVELPEQEALGELQTLATFAAALILGAMIFSFLVVVLATNRMLRPLRTLSDFASRLAQGELDARAPDRRQDELGALAAAMNHMAQELQAVYRSLEERVQARTRQIRTAAEVARAVTSILSLDDLLRQAVILIKDRFGYDFVALYLLDKDGRYALLREASGEAGAALKAQGHRIEVGSSSLIGWVSQQGKARRAAEGDPSGLFRRHERLPEIRSQAAIPLQVAGRILGVLDVQSSQPQAINEEDLEVLQALADQLSAAIENARLAQVSMTAAERARLVSQITARLSGLMEPAEVLRTAAQELHRGLGSAEILVTLVPPEEQE